MMNLVAISRRPPVLTDSETRSLAKSASPGVFSVVLGMPVLLQVVCRRNLPGYDV